MKSEGGNLVQSGKSETSKQPGSHGRWLAAWAIPGSGQLMQKLGAEALGGGAVVGDVRNALWLAAMIRRQGQERAFTFFQFVPMIQK